MDDVAIPTEDVQGVLVTYKYALKANEAVLIQISTAGQTIDKSALRAALDSVPTTGYYTKNDRWNGRTTSETGFWNELSTIVKKAQAVYDNEDVTQTKVDEALVEFNAAYPAAIANLIPTSRVNATALYETLHTDWRWNLGNSLEEGWPENTLWEKPSADNCTTLSWPPYAKALKDAQALLDTLYENGKPTDENTASKQGEVDKLAAAADAHMLVNKEAYAAAYDKYMAAKPEAEALLQQYDPAKLKESDYTADSWTAYTNAHAVLKTDMAYRIVGGTTEDWKMLQGFNGYYAYNDAGQWTQYVAHIEALKNAYRALTSGVDVTVSFTYLNNFSALYPSFGGTSLYANSSLTLATGSTDLTGLMAQAGLIFDEHDDNWILGGSTNLSDTIPNFLLLVNGDNYGIFAKGEMASKTMQFHNGDDIRLFRILAPVWKVEASSGLDSTRIEYGRAVYEEHYRDSIALIDMSAPGELQVGDKAKLSATVTGANTTNLGQSKSAAGITLFISDPSETEALSQPTHKTTAVTGADGSLQYVFTKPGWYTVAMFNVTPDELTFTDVYQSTTIGEYYSLYGGDYALIHVTEADDPAALLKQYRAEKAAEAKAYFDNFHDYDFTAGGYAALKAQYETLTANLQKATDLTALMETYDADFTCLKELGAAAIDHAAVIAGLRQNLSYLPDDLNDLNANYKTLVEDIQTVYGGLNSYQKKMLSANETKRLDAVAKIDADSLKTPAKVTLEVDVDENQLPKKKDNGNPYFGWPNIKWVVTPNVDGTLSAPNWAYPSFGTAKAGDHAFIRYYLDTTDEKYWPMWSVDGGKTWNLMEPQTLVTPDDMKTAYDGYYLAEYVIPDDVVDGSTITFKVKMISKTEYQAMTADSKETVAAARTAALSRLQTLYNSLGDKAKAAYDEGVKNINAAASVTAVETAYQSAVVAMKEAAANYGKVQVIVENTTYSKKNGAPWDGTLVDTWVDLSADSTMMSCVAAALKTKNATVVGAESNYISSINGLGEFDGNKSAGWMGTLNDWFTNEGFGAFTVKNGKLTSGDVIRIMFTSSGYGADLGGTWGNSDTTVKALTVDGAMLTPNFIPGEAGGQYDYTLIIDGESASVKLTPTASNKNFQVKTFLNEKVTDSSEGSSFFKRTETIPVKVGDTIYLGCGAKNWLSMNNQAGNKQNSDGTWYALHVVNINTGARYVTDLIAKLPTSLKYETYTRSMNDVAAARAAYGVLVQGEQDKVTNLAKLVNLEKQIEGFTAVDAFKVQLAALPEAEKLSVNDREAVDAAEAAYRTLTDALKDCLTVAEKEKAETVFAKMAEIKGNVVLAVEKQIDAIGEVTLENEAAVRAAQAAYDALTAEQKQLVNSEKVAALNAAVAKLAELKRVKLLAEMGDIYASVGESLQAQVNKSAPIVGSIGGEWLALGLARSGRSVPAGYYDNVVQYVKANVNANERLHNSKSTDNSRVILALTAIGKDPTNVGGHNLLKGLDSMSYINKQGINGPVFSLIALDSHNYPTFGEVTRDVLIDRILSEQVKADGGWALGGADEEASDVDVTAMTIQALAPYYKTNAKVKTAVDKGLTWLSEHQQEDGGFASWGAVNSESCAQVIVALAALGIDPLTDSRFIKNGITALDALCGYYTQDDTLGKGFAHVKQSSGGYVGGAYNQMATEQAYYALNAYYRFANSQNRLYDMTDVCIPHNFGAWTVTKAATCTESGISTRKCSVCGTEETMIVPSLGHSMTATAGKAATCTEAGNSAYWSCSRCHKYFSDAAGKTEIAKDSWVIAALGHDEATRAAVAATCYASGHEADTYCKRCGIVLAAGATIPATGKHTYVNGVCTVCGVRNPTANVKTDDIKVDSKDNTIVTGGGLTIKTDKPVTDEKLAEIKAAVESGSITVKVDNKKAIQTTDEQKKADGGKSALESAAASAAGDAKNELTKLIDKLADMRKDSSGKKDAQIEKVVDVTVELVKTVNEQVTSVAQLIELPQSVTVTISITDEMYNSLLNRKVCVVRSHTDANGNVTTTELPAYLGGTEGNRVLSFQTDKASTFAIVSYETVSTGSGSGSITVVKPTSANTADDSQMVIWLGSAVMAAAAVVVLTRKQKRVSK